jgi:hypothetical protein
VHNREGSQRRWRLFTIALLCTHALLWVSGHIGKALTRWVVPPFLPLELSDLVVLDRLATGTPPGCPDFGLLLIISPARAEEMINQALPSTRWLPPGIAHDGVILHGSVKRAALDLPIESDLPLIVAVSRNIGRRPRLVCRVPATVINTLFKEELEDDLASEEEHMFGEYRIIYRPTFKSFDLHSVEDYVPEPVMRRRFAFSATGDMRIKLDDKHVRITTDGRVRRLKGILDVRVLYDHTGYGFWYDVDMRNLRINIENLQEMLDSASSRKLEKALEKALDRRKSKIKFMKKRVPHWVPIDLALDFQLTPIPK